MRTLFLKAEIREKAMRHKASPYNADNPEQLGAKGANAVAPFMLSLERLGKAELIEDYWQVFMLFGAAILMIDDWDDLEKDLSAGHYSFVTLGFDELYKSADPKKTAQVFRSDMKRVRETYDCSKQMIGNSRAMLDRLNDPYLIRLVDVTEARLDSFFQKRFKAHLDFAFEKKDE